MPVFSADRNPNAQFPPVGHSHLRTFTDEQGRFWLEQNAQKESRWAKSARRPLASNKDDHLLRFGKAAAAFMCLPEIKLWKAAAG